MNLPFALGQPRRLNLIAARWWIIGDLTETGHVLPRALARPALGVLLGFASALGPFASFAAATSETSGPTPAQVTHPTTEADLATITLTPEAEQRLGIQTVAVVRRAVPITELFAGEVVRPLALGGENPVVGPLVGGSLDEVLRVADAQADGDGRVRQAEVALRLAVTTLERAEKVLAAEAGSVRTVDEARAQVELAEATLEVARERRALLGDPILSPGVANPLWIRVPIYAGALPKLDPSGPATVNRLSAEGQKPGTRALPVAGPQTANPLAATVDLFYQLDGVLPGLRPGERLAVRVPLRGEAEGLVVPWAAVLHDRHGGQWVYERIAPRTFVRRRVAVDRVVEMEAILAHGPRPPAQLVTDGAAELFGTEFGAGK